MTPPSRFYRAGRLVFFFIIPVWLLLFSSEVSMWADTGRFAQARDLSDYDVVNVGAELGSVNVDGETRNETVDPDSSVPLR